MGKGYQILNCDDTPSPSPPRKDPHYRPDIIHQELLAVLNGPEQGRKGQAIFVHTQKNVLFKVSPHTRAEDVQADSAA